MATFIENNAKLVFGGPMSRDISIIPQHMIKCMVLYKVYGAIMLCTFVCVLCCDRIQLGMLYASREGRCK